MLQEQLGPPRQVGEAVACWWEGMLRLSQGEFVAFGALVLKRQRMGGQGLGHLQIFLDGPYLLRGCESVWGRVYMGGEMEIWIVFVDVRVMKKKFPGAG